MQSSRRQHHNWSADVSTSAEKVDAHPFEFAGVAYGNRADPGLDGGVHGGDGREVGPGGGKGGFVAAVVQVAEVDGAGVEGRRGAGVRDRNGRRKEGAG